MSIESDTTVLHGVTPPKPDPEPELKSEEDSKLKKLKSEQEPKLKKLKSESYNHKCQKAVALYLEEDSSDEDHMPEECLEYYRKCKKADALYLKRSRNPYNAIAASTSSLLGGSYYNFQVVNITDEDNEDLDMLKDLSQTALLRYQEEHSGASFEFHKLVRCAYRPDCHPNKSPAHRRPTEYYITFKAKPKAKGDPSNGRRTITTFLATVFVDVVDKTKPPVVKECRIKCSRIKGPVWKGKRTIFE